MNQFKQLSIMENYEQMFKEITRKLYGDSEIDNIVVNYQVLPSNESTDVSHDEALPSDNDHWISSDETISWTKSKIASYNSLQKMFRCNDCECVGLLTRIAEHWLGTHANLRVFQCSQCSYASAWARCVRMHLARQHNITNEQSLNAEETLLKESPILEEVTNFLQRLKSKVEGDLGIVEIKQEPIEDQEILVKQEPGGLKVEVLDDTLTGEVPLSVAVPLSVEIPASIPIPVSVAVTVPPVQELPPVKLDEIPATIPTSTTIIIKAPIISTEIIPNNSSLKRYNCGFCSYATDRRDLFTRHENIHKDTKPFHCYVCSKQFSRADHVKKHFVRIHRDQSYNINRIKRDVKGDINNLFVQVPPRSVGPTISKNNINIISVQQQISKREKSPKNIPDDKKFSCVYCSWTGMGNWCLKRHLNTHLKPYTCTMCEYKAARPERLTTHIVKVHNRKICEKCTFFTDEESKLSEHIQQEHLFRNT